MRHWRCRYRDVLPEALAQVIGECLEVGTPVFRRTVQVEQADRPPAYFGVSVSPLSGQPHGAICLFTDLTPVVEMEEQLRLKESLARVGELTAGIAHEFRNGLATIHGYARLLDLKALPAVVSSARSRHPAGDRSAWPGGDELPELCAAAAVDALADRCPRCCRACRRRSAKRGARARRRCGRQRGVPGHRGRRCAVAAGVQQPVEECRRSVR